MLRIRAKTSASDTSKYFFGYYSEVDMDKPIWKGKTAEKLGIKGEVTKEDFEAILDNRNPVTGNQITPRNDENRRIGYELNFSAPKSVSLTQAITENKDIIEAFKWAKQKTMTQIEADGETRVRVNGNNENRKTGNLIYTSFIHGETREVEIKNEKGEIINSRPDPHLHDHTIVANMTWDDAE